MGRFFPRVIWFTMLLALSAGLAVGCQKQDNPQLAQDPPQLVQDNGSVRPDPFGPPGDPLANEDPDVADYIKRKGWSLIHDIRLSYGKRLIFLTVQDRDKPFEQVAITDDDYKMIARSKTVQVLDLNNVKSTDDGLKVVAGIPQLEGIIVNGDDVTDAGIKALAQCRSLDNVALFTKNVTDAGVKELAALPKLQSIHLLGLPLSGSAFEAFAGSKTLESVTLEYAEGFTDDGARHLAKLPNLKKLKIGTGLEEKKLTAVGIRAILDTRLPAKFEFGNRLIDDDLLEALVAKGWLYGPTPPGAMDKKPATPDEVEHINLAYSKVTDKGLQAVLHCTNIRSLFLEQTGVTDETMKKLSAFRQLGYLQLDKTKVTAAGLEAISGLPIKHVSMGECELTEDTFKALGKMTVLDRLGLSDAKMKAEWLKHIATLPKLRELNLFQTDFDDAAVKHLTTMPNLQELVLNNTRLGDPGFRELLKLPKLRKLYVSGTRVSKEVYQKAKEEHPELFLDF